MGVPRSGKTTFAKMIMNNYKNFSIVQADVIKSAYIDLCRYNAKQNYSNEIIVDESATQKLISSCFDYYTNYEPNINFILDTFDFNLEAAKEYVNKGYIIIVFGYPNITVAEAIENTEKYDTELDWTYIESYSRKNYLFKIYIMDSKKYQKECEMNNIKFVDTSKNREDVLNNLFKWLNDKL